MPLIAPNYCDLILPDYIGSKQNFDNSDFIRKSHQLQPIGTTLNIKYQLLDNRCGYDDLIAYYNSVNGSKFELPTGYISLLPPDVQYEITTMSLKYWTWEKYSSTPRIINNAFRLYDLTFDLVSS